MSEKFHSSPQKLVMQATWQFRLAVGITGLTAAFSALRVAFNLGYNNAVFHTLDGVHATCCVNFLESFLIPITICLFVSFVSLWLRQAAGFLVSLMALLVIPVIYVYWYFGTRSIMRRAEVATFVQLPDQSQHFLALANATWWDIYVLLMVIVLIVWQLKTVVPFLFPPRRNMLIPY